MSHPCPVCLTTSLDEPYQPYSYDICRMCGVEFGYDDSINEIGLNKDEWRETFEHLISLRHDKLRKIWQNAGCPNWWEKTRDADFESGVPWFDKYWQENPDEYEEWQMNLSSFAKMKSGDIK